MTKPEVFSVYCSDCGKRIDVCGEFPFMPVVTLQKNGRRESKIVCEDCMSKVAKMLESGYKPISMVLAYTPEVQGLFTR